jgi:hypothetical protein
MMMLSVRNSHWRAPIRVLGVGHFFVSTNGSFFVIAEAPQSGVYFELDRKLKPSIAGFRFHRTRVSNFSVDGPLKFLNARVITKAAGRLVWAERCRQPVGRAKLSQRNDQAGSGAGVRPSTRLETAGIPLGEK